MKYVLFLAACLLALFVAGGATADVPPGWQVIYSEDFSTGAPGWTASDGGFYWNADRRAYHSNIADGGNDWAYVPVPYTTGSFCLQFDWFPIRTDDFSNHRFGMWGPEMSTSYYVGDYTQYCKGGWSEPRTAYLQFFPCEGWGSDPENFCGEFNDGIWYHGTIEYLVGPVSEIRHRLVRMQDGVVISSEVFRKTGGGLNFDGVDRLAMSSIGDIGSGNTAEAYWDNVLLSVPVPEPSSLLMLACGLASLGGLVWRRNK